MARDAAFPPNRKAASWRRVISVNSFRVLTINAVLGLLIGAGLYGASEPTALFHLMGFSGSGGISGAAELSGPGHPGEAKSIGGEEAVPLVGTGSLAADDPVLRFAQTRVGQLLFSSAQSDNCQRVLFDNTTGASFDVRGVFCGQTADGVNEQASLSRLKAVRASFQK